MNGAGNVVVLGAGIQGCCIALELARRGIRVVLIDREDRPLTQASFWNEGKIHLGFIYAADPSRRTAPAMMAGALCFSQCLERWGVSVADCLSDPFHYVVHQDSLLLPDEVEAHFAGVADHYAICSSASGQSYLGQVDEPVYAPLSAHEARRIYNPQKVKAAFRTIERSVDPQVVARRLTAAVLANSRISFLGQEYVRTVEENGGDFTVVTIGRDMARRARRYATVVNSLWDDRVRIDAGLGLHPARPLLLRYKLAIHLRLDSPPSAAPTSTTMMLGPFGDVVSLPGGRFYLSWYPACRFLSHAGIDPPDWKAQVTPELRRSVADETLARLAEIVPNVAALGAVTDLSMVDGGAVVTWGDSDIDDPHSEVHQRFDIGVTSNGSYHSVDTGKYSVAPYFAMQVADRIAAA